MHGIWTPKANGTVDSDAAEKMSLASLEPSFASPDKSKKQWQRNLPLQTPRPNSKTADSRPGERRREFTPLLKSAAANKIRNAAVQLSPLRKAISTPTTPSTTDENSPSGKSMSVSHVKAMADQSMASTGTNGRDLKSAPTLKEQDASTERLENENFDLKLRVHFLEEMLRGDGIDKNDPKMTNVELQAQIAKLTQLLKKSKLEGSQTKKDLLAAKSQMADTKSTDSPSKPSEEAQTKIDELQAECDHLKDSLDIVHDENEALKNEVARAQEERQQYVDKAEDLEADLRRETDAKDEWEELNESLQNELRSLKADNEQLEQEVGEVRDRNDRLGHDRSQNEGYNDEEVHALRIQIDEINAELEDRNKELERLRDSSNLSGFERGQYKRDMEELSRKLATIADERDSAIQQQRKAEAELDIVKERHTASQENSRRTVQELEESKDSLTSRITELSNEISALKSTIDDLSNSDSPSGEETERLRRALRNESERHEHHEQAVRSELGSLQQTLSDVKMELGTKDSEYHDLREGFVSVERQLKNAQADLKTITAEHENLQQESSNKVRDLEDEIALLSEKHDKAEMQMKSYRDNFTKTEQSHKALDTSVQRLRSQLRTVQTERDNLNEEKHVLQKSVSELEKEVFGLRQSVAEAETHDASKNVTDTQEKLKKATDTLAKKEKDIEGLYSKIRGLEQELDAFHEQCDRLNSELEKNSENRRDFSIQKIGMMKMQEDLQAAQNELEAYRNMKQTSTKANHTDEELARLEEECATHIAHVEKLQNKLVQRNGAIKKLEGLIAKQPQYLEEIHDSIRQEQSEHARDVAFATKQIRYLKARVARERSFRADLAYSKGFFKLQIENYESFNQIGISLLKDIGIYPDARYRNRRASFRAVALTVRTVIRMRKLQQFWAPQKQAKKQLSNILSNDRMS